MSVKVEHSVTAKCKPEHAWQKFQKLEEWSWWNRAIGTSKWLDGQPWQPGSRFLLELAYPKKMTFKPVITENISPHSIAWKDEGGGLAGTMRFRFEPAEGGTVLKSEADFSGWKTMLSAGGVEDALRRSYEEWLSALKTEAEKIAREELARS